MLQDAFRLRSERRSTTASSWGSGAGNTVGSCMTMWGVTMKWKLVRGNAYNYIYIYMYEHKYIYIHYWMMIILGDKTTFLSHSRVSLLLFDLHLLPQRHRQPYNLEKHLFYCCNQTWDHRKTTTTYYVVGKLFAPTGSHQLLGRSNMDSHSFLAPPWPLDSKTWPLTSPPAPCIAHKRTQRPPHLLVQAPQP